MKTTTTIKFKASYEEPISIACDKCGNVFQPKNKKDYFWINQLQHFEFSWNFGSKFDEEVWEFDLCEDCLNELVKSFEIPPIIKREFI